MIDLCSANSVQFGPSTPRTSGPKGTHENGPRKGFPDNRSHSSLPLFAICERIQSIATQNSADASTELDLTLAAMFSCKLIIRSTRIYGMHPLFHKAYPLIELDTALMLRYATLRGDRISGGVPT